MADSMEPCKMFWGTEAFKGIPGYTKCVTEILGAKIWKLGGGTKFTVYHFVLRGNKRIKPITEILGDRNKEVGGNTVLGHSAVSLPFQ